MRFKKLFFAVTMITAMTFVSCSPKDVDLKTAIEQKIQTMPNFKNAVVEVAKGVVTLKGELPDQASIDALMVEAKTIKGVKDVVNSCTVMPLVVINEDSAIIADITTAMKAFPGAKADVKDGVVTLNGEISKADLPKLMKAVSSLKPKKIENKMVVK